MWGTAMTSNIVKLQRLQSKILRIITGAPWFIKNANLHRDLGLPTVIEKAARCSHNMFFIFKSDVILHIFVVLLFIPIFNSYPIFNQPDLKHTNYLSLNNDLQTPFMDETIEEVRQLWEQDSNLPRLTRGEIQELYEKIKREDFETTKKVRDLTRAEGVRALMLVLPYNTDNKTKENLQDLYTRPPVTKVINIYAQPQPIKFVTPDPNTVTKNEIPSILNLAATTYKPNYSKKNVIVTASPSTSHPPTQPVIKKLSPIRTDLSAFQPITNSTDYNTKYLISKPKSTHRYSSHYNAKDIEFSKLPIQMNTKPFINTVKPVFEVLKTLGIVDQKNGYHQPLIDDFFQAESAPKPVVSSFTVKNHQSATQKIRSDAYLNFKPLNIGEEIRIKPEVEGYLTRFGIVGGRQFKDLNKKSYVSGSDKQASEKREVVAQVANREGNKSKKSTLIDNTELEKLIQNLQELERLNNNANTLTTSAISLPTSTQATSRLSNVLTINGESSLNEPNKLRRRIDPNIDTNDNRQIDNNKSDEVAKLLENLQELEKLRINPQNALQLVVPTNKTVNLFNRSDAIITQTSLPIKSQTLTNRFNDLILEQQSQQQTHSPKLSQNLEVAESESIEKPTVQPKLQQPRTRANFSPTDFLQLQKILSNESELKRLYEQVRLRTTPKTTTTTTITIPTKKPISSNQNDLQLLQKYLAELNRASYTTEAQSTSTISLKTLPPSIITTPMPSVDRNNYSILMSQKPNAASSSDDLHKLIGRIQQLESFNIQPNENQSTELPPHLDFISRNVKAEATANDYHVPINDFAQLQQLYKQTHYEDQAPLDKAEIPTALTASGFLEELKTPNENNETESGSSLQKVDPNEFIQLQKLLSKVQELERVKLKTDGSEAEVIPTPIRTKSQRDANLVSNMLTVASTSSINATKISNSHTVYPENLNSYKYLEDLLFKEADLENLKLNLSNHEVTTFEPNIVQNTSLVWKQTTNEKIDELDHVSLSNPDKSKYTHPMDAETESNKYIYSSTADKTATKEVPKFISIPKREEYDKIKTSNIKQDNSEALQKLLNNAQRLENLSIILPKKLSEQLETKPIESNSRETIFQKLPIYIYSDNKTATNILNLHKNFNLDMSSKEELDSMKQKTVVFSLTTMKSPLPKLPKTTTESTVQLPIFSATKIIEDAIKLAANKIGVSTEHPQGFRRRSDVYDNKTTVKDSDLIGEFSDMHYQIAIPDINHELREKSTELLAEQKPSDSIKQNIFEREIKKSEDIKKKSTTAESKKSDLSELQRLVNNLQELKKLNINITSDMIKQLDEKYLEEFKHIHPINDDQKKSRRQSEDISTYTTSDLQAGTVESYSTKNIKDMKDITAGPLKFNFGLSFNDSDRDAVILSSNKDILAKSSPVNATEESQSSSLADLEDSFGPDPNKEETLPPKKKNGFYFLADWNSFLEVGDGDDQVVVKLDPKIGDPRLFLPIKVP
ncbi:uncharacterized protein LOC119668778 [Teleopsis dalmanni]|uniref:uncharacterized protein LOC119668778 n=1 Tax=Teleopsis dalmanni TaxID=139649 RepID=UPI0018CFE9E3|nr:uncharacterized protein LOC119668778 [Teleopsis dalmanni]